MKIGLALGAGGVRAFSHIGVIRVLEKQGIPIDAIAGTSMASFVGALYAATKDIEYLEYLAIQNHWPKILRVMSEFSFRYGLFRGNYVKQTIEKALKRATFSDLLIPFAAAATDLHSGKTVSITEGDVSEAVFASSAVPALFNPVKRQDMLLVDGGVSSPIPVDSVKSLGVDMVIAVDPVPEHDVCSTETKDGIFEVINHSLTVVNYLVSRQELKSADAIIHSDCSSVAWTDIFSEEKIKRVIAIGEASALRNIDMIKEKMRETENPFVSAQHSVQHWLGRSFTYINQFIA